MALSVTRSNHSARYHARTLHIRLDLLHTRLELIHTLLDLIHTRLDLIHARLDLINTWPYLIHIRLDLIHTWLGLIHSRLHELSCPLLRTILEVVTPRSTMITLRERPFNYPFSLTTWNDETEEYHSLCYRPTRPPPPLYRQTI